MKPGDIVKRRDNEEYAVVRYSTFGISLHSWNEEYQALGKTLGDNPSIYEKYWEVIDALPDGWVIGSHGCPIKEK